MLLRAWPKMAAVSVGFLNPDCCSDYRRRGRLWLRADAILAARRSFKNFYVPSVPDEFIYYLIKKVLKQSMHACHLRRLHGLYQRAPQDCGAWLHRFWSAHTANALEQALVEKTSPGLHPIGDLLLSELEASRPVERTLARFASRLRRVAGSVRRVLQPTGMCVIVSGEDETQAWNIATALQQSLEPAFRWTSTVRVALEPVLPTPAQETIALARFLAVLELSRHRPQNPSRPHPINLAICTIDHGELAPGKHRLSSMFMRLHASAGSRSGSNLLCSGDL